jgi:hypothetical protein
VLAGQNKTGQGTADPMATAVTRFGDQNTIKTNTSGFGGKVLQPTGNNKTSNLKTSNKDSDQNNRKNRNFKNDSNDTQNEPNGGNSNQPSSLGLYNLISENLNMIICGITDFSLGM